MRARAGILIHVLLLAAAFTLVLEFYLFSTLSSQENLIIRRAELRDTVVRDIREAADPAGEAEGGEGQPNP